MINLLIHIGIIKLIDVNRGTSFRYNGMSSEDIVGVDI